MLFNSIEFWIFFPVVFTLYWSLRGRLELQNGLLLFASLFFYGWWDVRFLFLFLLTTTVDFYCALMVGSGAVAARQRAIVSLILVGSAFACVTVRWDAVSWTQSGLRISLLVDWPHLLPASLAGWAVFLTTTVVVVAVNLLHRRFTRIGEVERRRRFLVASIVSNLGVLGFFKYYDFFADSFLVLVHGLFGSAPHPWMLHLALPVGISFYTFQSMAYTIEVYRSRVTPMTRYFPLGSYLSFFPLLVAGPIERPFHLLPQFLSTRTLTGTRIRDGVWLFFWGLFKKMVVADNMAKIVHTVFAPYDGAGTSALVPHDGLRLLVGLYAFAFQIYGDFSGYSDIARGSAKLLGFDVMLNFNLPYFAISPSDFWRRWHISLSTWLRDYLYISLGGNRHGDLFTYRNLFLTMLLGGLWHGAAWTFVLWGAYHGLLLIGYRLIAPELGERPRRASTTRIDPEGAPTWWRLRGLRGLLSRGSVAGGQVDLRTRTLRLARTLGLFGLGVVMFHLTCLGWLLFRAQNLTTVRIFLEGILRHPGGSAAAGELFCNLIFYGWFLALFEVLQRFSETLNPMPFLPRLVRVTIWVFLVMSLLTQSAGHKQEFIYFAF
ncbi:MAG TPA: MBOAT family O-acyltransferase [Myxococcota bacterium]|nr:MBOAT family O-acyltransferase [Myxococcota bacterium]